MFGRKKQEVVPVATLPRPTKQPVDNINKEALELMTKLNIPGCRKLELQDFLQRNEIPVYNIRKVWDYLDQVMGKWHWCSVTKAAFNIEVYDKPIPLEALKLMAKIRDAFPEVNFYVSVAGEPHPDPFLCVCLPQEHNNMFVIAFWDDPGFSVGLNT
jgi:hypothetical protein